MTSARQFSASLHGSLMKLHHATGRENMPPSGQLILIVGTHLISLAFNEHPEIREILTSEHLLRPTAPIAALLLRLDDLFVTQLQRKFVT